MSRQVSTIASDISRAPYSAWAYSLCVNSSRSWIEWYVLRSGSEVPTAPCVQIVRAPVARSAMRSSGAR
jgi:hypothetical protein